MRAAPTPATRVLAAAMVSTEAILNQAGTEAEARIPTERPGSLMVVMAAMAGMAGQVWPAVMAEMAEQELRGTALPTAVMEAAVATADWVPTGALVAGEAFLSTRAQVVEAQVETAATEGTAATGCRVPMEAMEGTVAPGALDH